MKVNKETGELYLYGVVYDGMYEGCFDDLQVIEALEQIGDKRAKVRLNTVGGSVDIGVSIKNALDRHTAGCDIYVDGLAASIGSYIMLAGDSITMASGTRVMIHSPWTPFAYGNAKELRKLAETLDKYEESLVPEYADAMGIEADEVRFLLDEETWYTASEASGAFVKATTDEESETTFQSKVSAGVYKHTPADLVSANGYKGIAALASGLKLRKATKPRMAAVDIAAASQAQINRQVSCLTSDH